MAKTETQRRELLRRLRKLADRRVNDAVRLAFLDGEHLEELAGLDLSGLVELKKSDRGFEAKFVDQVKVLEMMGALMEEDGGADTVDQFFRALDQAAGGEEP